MSTPVAELALLFGRALLRGIPRLALSHQLVAQRFGHLIGLLQLAVGVVGGQPDGGSLVTGASRRRNVPKQRKPAADES